jgi:hypothetical protein
MDGAGLIQRHSERLGRRIDMRDRLVALQCPPLENRRFSGATGFGIEVFERQQNRVIRIAREGLDVVAAG